VIAVVATALTTAAVLETPARVGSRAENLEVVEARDAREPGRNGDDATGTAWLCGTDDAGCFGDDNGGSGGESLVVHSSLEGGMDSDEGFSGGDSGTACARSRDNDEGPADGVEFARGRVGNRCEVGG